VHPQAFLHAGPEPRPAALLGERQRIVESRALGVAAAEEVEPRGLPQQEFHPLLVRDEVRHRERAVHEREGLGVQIPGFEVVERGREVAVDALAARAREVVFAEIDAERAVEVLGVLLGGVLPGLERLGEGGVVLLAKLVVQRAVERLLHLVVVEDVLAPGRADETVPLLDLAERLECRDARHAENGADERRIELEPHARRDVEKVALVVGQVGHARVDEIEYGRRDLDLVDHVRRDPGAVRGLRDELPVSQPPQDLEHEERVAVRLHGDLSREFFCEALGAQ
jgi:hypothetical protein